jgi:hypothetical protein
MSSGRVIGSKANAKPVLDMKISFGRHFSLVMVCNKQRAATCSDF